MSARAKQVWQIPDHSFTMPVSNEHRRRLKLRWAVDWRVLLLQLGLKFGVVSHIARRQPVSVPLYIPLGLRYAPRSAVTLWQVGLSNQCSAAPAI